MNTVLIAEDDFNLRTLFVKVMRHANFDVCTATDGYEAQASLTQSLPDILLLDVNMPGPSGLELIQFVRRTQGSHHVNIIMVTGDHLAQQSDTADQADLFLHKPVNPADLVTFSNRLLQPVIR